MSPPSTTQATFRAEASTVVQLRVKPPESMETWSTDSLSDAAVSSRRRQREAEVLARQAEVPTLSSDQALEAFLAELETAAPTARMALTAVPAAVWKVV